MMDELQVTELKWLGLISAMMEKSSLSETVTQLMPAKRVDTIVSNANCAKALILNMLSAGPAALSVISQNFETMPVGHLLAPEITAAQLNDDRLGRFLDEFYEAGASHIANQYFLTGLLPCLRLSDPLELHADLTSFHVHGAYQKPQGHGFEQITVADSVIHITHGYSRDHHPELKQFGLSMVVEAKANIPIQIKPLDGNAADGEELREIASRLKKDILPFATGQCLYVADAALYSHAKLTELHDGGIKFLTRMPATSKAYTELLTTAMEQEQLCSLDDENLGYDTEFSLPAKSGIPPLTLRAVVVRSKKRVAQQEYSVRSKILKESEKEMKDFRKLCQQSFACEEDCQKAITKALSNYRFLRFDKIYSGGRMLNAKGNPTKSVDNAEDYEHKVEWAGMHTELSALTTLAEASGWFILVTNDRQMSAIELLNAYKRQSKVERGFRFLKSPQFFTDSIFLKTPRRIESMLCLMTMALAVYAGLEYFIRQTLVESKTTVSGQNNKPTENPTARWVFQLFQKPMVVTIPSAQVTKVIQVQDWQKTFISSLGPEFMRFYPT